MRLRLSKNSEEEIAVTLFILALLLAFFSGCDFISSFKKEVKEEKKILGYVDGYNPKIKELERILKAEGFDPGKIDGVVDKKTRKAIKEFQRANKIKDTGFINTKTRAKLDFLNFERTKERQKTQTQEVKQLVSSAEQIKKIQRALKKAGFDPGPIDGIMNTKTKKAITEFQKSRGLIVDGIVGKKTWEELSKYFPKS